MKTIVLCIVISTILTGSIFAKNNKTGFTMELAQAEHMLLETAHTFPKVGEAFGIYGIVYFPSPFIRGGSINKERRCCYQRFFQLF